MDIVTFPEGKVQNPDNFTGVSFHGCVPQIIKQTMDYLRTTVMKEYVHKVAGQSEAMRYWNYPYEALEEAVVNSLYHRDYQQYEPVEITIEPKGISILNCPGPDRSISKEMLEQGDALLSRRYRNRRLGDFLKELQLTEGRSTGVPTMQAKLQANGSPKATFETTDERLTCLVFIPVHSKTKSTKSSVKSSVKTMEKAREKTREKIIQLIKANSSVSIPELATALDISTRAVEKQLKTLKIAGSIRRVGPDKGGHWEIL